MKCTEIEGDVWICSEPMEIAVDRPDGVRWCFVCRKRTEFYYVVMMPTDPMSYYGPSPSVRCGECRTHDGDLFPGRYREWEG